MHRGPGYQDNGDRFFFGGWGKAGRHGVGWDKRQGKGTLFILKKE